MREEGGGAREEEGGGGRREEGGRVRREEEEGGCFDSCQMDNCKYNTIEIVSF